MDKAEIIDFFDKLAPDWDKGKKKNPDIINEILDNACIEGQVSVLDVACGTGVMFPFYMERGIKNICGVDISGEMIKAAENKFPQKEIQLFNIDAEEFSPGRKFDRIMIFNAFPHFVNPEKLISHLSRLLNEGGILSVAHSMSRQLLDSHHKECAQGIAQKLMPAKELETIFSKTLKVIISVDNDKMYQLCGKKL